MFCLQTSLPCIPVLCQNQINKPHHFIFNLSAAFQSCSWMMNSSRDRPSYSHAHFLLLPPWHATFLPRIQTADSQQTAADQVYLLLYQHKKKDHMLTKLLLDQHRRDGMGYTLFSLMCKMPCLRLDYATIIIIIPILRDLIVTFSLI